MSDRTIYLVKSITECARCAGSGTIPNVDWAEVTCPVCRGQGYLDGDAVPLEAALAALEQRREDRLIAALERIAGAIDDLRLYFC